MVKSTVNFLFQNSTLISSEDKKSLNSIGLFLVQIPVGLLKSGIPDSVDIPAPVKTTVFELSFKGC